MVAMQDVSTIKRSDAQQWRDAVATTTGLLQIFSFPKFFAAAASSLAELLDADGVALIVHDGPDQLRYKLFHGLESLNQAPIVKFSFPAHEGTVGRVLAEGEPLFTANYPISADAMPEFVAAGLRANLVLPLPGPAGFVGAIAIAWLHRQAPAVTPAALAIAQMFAALVGSSVHRERLEKQLKSHSLTDPLTGLPNRRMLMRRLASAQKRACRTQSLMVLAVLDLDGFKAVNDELGHACGDQHLRLAADAIQGAIRDIDMAARVGGDEFVIVLESLRSAHEARVILDRIVNAIAEGCGNDATGHKITASLGATMYPLDFAEPETLLKHADKAMYLAKRDGGDQCRILLPAS